MNELLEFIKNLRMSTAGCAWTQAQTCASLAPQTLEEAHELVDAIEEKGPQAVRDELGDLLYHVVLYAQIASEDGSFDFTDIVAGVLHKHQRRMPSEAMRKNWDAEQVNTHWNKLKKQERRQQDATSSALDDIPKHLPATLQASKLLKRAARAGFAWPDQAALLAKIQEELQEVQAADSDTIEEEYGDFLLACVNLGRSLKINPETALRKANRKFTARFKHLEQSLGGQLDECSQQELQAAWDAAKA